MKPVGLPPVDLTQVRRALAPHVQPNGQLDAKGTEQLSRLLDGFTLDLGQRAALTQALLTDLSAQREVAARAQTVGLGGAIHVTEGPALREQRDALATLVGGQLSFERLHNGEVALENVQLMVTDGRYRTNVPNIGATEDEVVRNVFAQLTRPGVKVVAGLSDPEVVMQWRENRWEYVSGNEAALTEALERAKNVVGPAHTLAEIRAALAPLFGGPLTFATAPGGERVLENNFLMVSDGQHRTNVRGSGATEAEALRATFDALTRPGTTVGIAGSEVKLAWSGQHFDFVSGDARGLAEALARAAQP